MSFRPPFFSGRYTLTQWFMTAWFIAGVISMLIGSAISFLPTDLVIFVLIAVGLIIGIAVLARLPASSDSPEWNQAMKTLPPPLKRAMFYFLVLLMLAFFSAANVYMVVLAAHAATSRSAEITLSVSYTGRDSGVLGRCSHYVGFTEDTFPFMQRTCISPEQSQIIHRGSRLQVSGSQSPMGFRPTSLRLCTPPLKCDQDNAVGDGVMQVFSMFCYPWLSSAAPTSRGE